MIFTVYFNYKPCFMTIKIYNIIIYYFLPQKLYGIIP